ncbi:aminophospholipid-transporting P-type ATPase [Paraphysoderma sedebokerense]|nr:aminophospholipid-transporting P-type ATPase [Paraphysoderma sedebokerense]
MKAHTLGRQPRQEGSRTIHLNDGVKNASQKFLHNGISTAKYNAVTFLPKFFFEQFSKYANLFFLFTACIQQIEGVSPTSRFATAIPLGFVLAATAFKEFAEDLKRHKADNEVNSRSVKVLQGTSFIEKRWDRVVVGDIVRVDNFEYFPADLILLSSSEPDAICYIETANLDGETNLKIKQGRQETASLITPFDVGHLEGLVQSELPNNSLYTFEGTMKFRDGRNVPLDPQQILLRGAQLRNTRWIYGLVVFTGHDSKLMRNASATPIKRTNVERMTNVQIIFLFGILLALSLACTVGTLVRDMNYTPFHSYLFVPEDLRLDFLKNILTFIILFNNLIPISLIVTMEVVKFQQAQLINADLDMYYAPTDTPALCRTSSLVEELGQIEYIFSDKTGTLTCNIMEFRQSHIGGKNYTDLLPEGKKNGDYSSDTGTLRVYDFNHLQKDLETGDPALRSCIDEFLLLLAACHTVIPEKNDDDPNAEIVYQASSPDEAALVQGAKTLGYSFTTRKPQSIIVNIRGRDIEIEILNICEFNSTRKRMSAVVRFPDGRIKLYCKGADTVILERLSKEPGSNPYVDSTLVALEEYASEGLRTLCIAMRDVSEDEYRKWSEIYNRAATTLNNRAAELDAAAELIEKNLTLLGATAIEDKLQDGVPETIHTLAMAGIKIWVLTGDRQETAINIGYSCKLLTEDMNLIIVNLDTHFETKEFLQKKLQEVQNIRPTDSDNNESLALIIDGRTLDFALEKDMQKTFLDLASMCKSVICCRVSPLQKALVVKLVKKYKSSLLLAIGDGANDVSMIQAAHVGIGISGQEGLQAARSADFAISQFKYLKKLLLVHGAWSYQRLSKLILYSFYKNITLYLTQFWFALYNGFSGQTIYESWTISYYNVLFAVLPPLVIGIFDQFTSARMLDRYPQLYMLGQNREFFNVKIFWGSTLNACFHSIILYFFTMGIFENDVIFGDGIAAGHWAFGMTLYTAVLATVIYKAGMITDLWTKWAWLSIFGSVLVWIIFLPLYSIIAPRVNFSEELFGMELLYSSGVFWFTVIVVPVLCLIRDYCWKFYKRMYNTRSYHIVQEIQKFNIPDYRPNRERFKKAVHKVRQIQRMKRNRGYAFSQVESGQADLIRVYNTTLPKPRG